MGLYANGQLNRLADKAYEALSIYDYFKAKKLFYQSYEKSPSVAAAYGLSVIYSRNDNPFYKADSASKYAQRAAAHFNEQAQSFEIHGFLIDNQQVNNQLKKCIQLCFREALNANQSLAWDKFLLQNLLAAAEVRTEAIYRRDELDFNKVLNENNSKNTRDFLKTHPVSQFYAEAFQLLERQIYEETCPNKNEQELKRFLIQFPKNKMRHSALDVLYSIYRKNNDVQGLKYFVYNYPQSPQINEAWKLLFSLSVRSYSDDELIRFLAMYPEFPLRNTILKELQFSSYRFFAFKNEGSYGYIDTIGNIRIPAMYDNAGSFKEELALVSRNDSVWFINKFNENVFHQVFDEAYGFNSGAAPVKFNGLWKFINRQGQVISPEYEEINELSDNLYVLKVKGKYGAINQFGQSMIEARFDYLSSFKNKSALYRDKDLYGFVNISGYVHKAEFDWLSDFDEWQMAIFRKADKFGLIERNGKVILEAKYNQVIRAENGIYILLKDNRYGFYSADKCFLSDVEYDFQVEKPLDYYFKNDWFRLLKNKSIALMDMNGAIRVNYGVYDDCGFFSNGLLRVKRKKKYAYVDRKLQLSIPYQYEWAEDFKDSVALVKKGGNFEIIDVNGKTLYSSAHKILNVTKQYFLTESNGGKSLINAQGQIILDHIDDMQTLEFPYYVFTLKNGQIKLLKL